MRNVLLFNPSAELMLDQTRAVVAALDYAFDVNDEADGLEGALAVDLNRK